MTALALARGRALIAARQFTTSATRSEIHPGYLKFKERQKAFQIDNGLKVHERGGAKDKVLYNFTLLVSAIVGFKILEYTYRGIFGKKE